MSEFKNLPSGWRVVRLGDVCNVKQGLQIPISERFCENAKNRYFYITNEFLKENSEVKYYIENPPEGTICICDDILMTRTGNTGRIVTNVSGVFHNNFFKIIYDRQIIKKEYFVFLLTGPKIQNEILKRAGSSTIPDLNHGDFLSIKILLPPLDEQEKIAEILSTWDEAINLTINLIENKKQFKKALMQNLLTAKIRFPEFQDEWRETKLKDICIKMRSGGTPKSTNRKFYNGNIPFVKINDMTLAGKYIYDTQAKITEEGLENSSAWLIPKNSLIYSMYASFGFVSINKIEVATSQAMMCIVPNLSKVALEYLYYFLDDFQKNVCSFVETGTQGNLNAEIVKNFKIKLPNLNEQQKIAEVLTACDDEINLLNLKLENLKKQKQGLMQKLLNGKVRI